MKQAKFFLLQDPISATEAESFLCRLVTSKTAPLDRFVPFSLPGAPSRNTNEIVTAIPPKPEEYTISNGVLTSSRELQLSLQFSTVIGGNLSLGGGRTRKLDTGTMKRYTISNPEVYFRELMNDESYAGGARKLLQKAWPSHCYLVTGFLTVKGSEWMIEETSSLSQGANATIPVAKTVAPGHLGDVSVGLSGSSGSQRSYQLSTTGEQIFAASYSTARLSYKVGPSFLSITRTPEIGRPKRAKAHHLAMGADDDEEEIDCASDSDGSLDTSPRNDWIQSGETSEVVIEEEETEGGLCFLEPAGERLYIGNEYDC